MRGSTAAGAALVLLFAGCASWRWSGYQPPGTPAPATVETPSSQQPRPVLAPPEETAALAVSTTPRAELPPLVAPPTPERRGKTALFYSDMGPDSADVSSYPAQQRYNYAIFARVCARCHTLARPLNAPLVGRGWWDFYILGMRTRSRWRGEPLSKDDVKAVLDFLEYDSRVRKVDDARRFDALTEELKRRFDVSVRRRMRALQESNPRPLAPPAP